jgi:hypothetical protein
MVGLSPANHADRKTLSASTPNHEYSIGEMEVHGNQKGMKMALYTIVLSEGHPVLGNVGREKTILREYVTIIHRDVSQGQFLKERNKTNTHTGNFVAAQRILS